jgi:hypothetical protein
VLAVEARVVCAGVEADHVQFGDAELPQQLTVWLFAAERQRELRVRRA